MSFMSGSRPLQNAKGNDQARQAMLGLSPAMPIPLPPLDSVEEVDSIIPRREEASTGSDSIIDIAFAISGQATTLRTTVRATGIQRTTSTRRSLLPTTTGRLPLGPTGFQTVRPLVGPSGAQTVRPPLQSSVSPLQVPATSSSRTSPTLVTTMPVSTASGLAPILPIPVPAATATSANALPEETTAAQQSITASPSSGIDAGSVVGYILLALVGVAALLGAGFFIKKKLSKRNDRPEPLVISTPSSASAAGTSPANEAPMVMARSYPDIAARLDTIAARAEQGRTGPAVSQPPPPPFRNDRVKRENPFVDGNRAADAQSGDGDEVPLVLARSYPKIAAELGAIAARAQRGESGAMPRQPQSQSPPQNSREERGFPFAEPPGRLYTERVSSDEGLESPIAPELSYATQRPKNMRRER